MDPSMADGTGRTWTSGLSVDDFALVRTAGYAPVGHVMGASAYTLTKTGSETNPRYPIDTVLNTARRDALRAMIVDCRALGGDGVIGVRVDIGPFLGERSTLAFRVQGTAVRARGPERAERPFVAALNAQEFTALIEAGWRPVDLVFGAAVELLWGFSDFRRQTMMRELDRVLGRYQDMVTRLWQAARTRLRNEATTAGADGILISQHGLETHRHEAFSFVEARLVGTAIAVAGPPERQARGIAPPKRVVRLSEEPGWDVPPMLPVRKPTAGTD